MMISSKGRYALRLMIDLACNNNGEYISLKDISKRQDISVKYLEQIVSLLSKNALIKSTRGAFGGYILSKPASEYTAGEILRVTEGDLIPVSCMETTPNQCPRLAKCPTIDFWKGLYDTVNNYVDSVSLQQLADDAEKNVPMDFSI